MTLWSLGEVEALARKAARGAGMTWGVAEDAGKATRWLMAAGLPGADLLAQLLSSQDGRDWAALCPDPRHIPWQAKAGPLCPIATGTAMSDMAHRWAEGDTLEIGPIRAPLLLVPFMINMADGTNTALCLSWEGAQIERADQKTHLRETRSGALTASVVEKASLGLTDEPSGDRIRRAWRARISDETAAKLGLFAQRLYAPETPERRAAGAGASNSDPD